MDQISRSCAKDARSSDSRSLQLQFSNGISLPVFTGTRIEGEGGSSIEVALVDVLTGQVVSSGPGSSAKVEIVVLEGDFDGDEEDNWILEEFTNNVVREREGKKPLLTGDVILTLIDGKGSVGDVSFTDNSSWTRSRKFRLGARLLDDIGGLRVREARSDPFVVRDHRGECEFPSWSYCLLIFSYTLGNLFQTCGACHERNNFNPCCFSHIIPIQANDCDLNLFELQIS